MQRMFYSLGLLGLFTFLCVTRAQDSSLFLSGQDFASRAAIAQRQPWARQSLDALLHEADQFPNDYMQRFGLSDAEPPPEGGQWLHWYVCAETGTALQFHPPDRNICPDTGKNYRGYPYDQVVYQLRNDALAEAAVALGLAFRFTNKQQYAQQAAGILTAYARVYPTYKLHDNSGKAGVNGANAYSQTLDESLWLIKIAWAYDLVRGANVLTAQEKQDIETKVLRPSVAVISKAHKEPTSNIQSWINGAIAAVGFTLADDALVHEAIDGPIGFHYQMHAFVHEGFWTEGTWFYQFYAMRPLTMLAQMATRHGIDLWQQEPALLTMFVTPINMTLPDGKLPAFNDSGPADLYEQDYLYEIAYAARRAPSLLSVLEHGPRNDREALLFGVETLPKFTAPRLVSSVYPEAGYAALRSSANDLTVLGKFGPHGGGHGHYDKLNFVLYADGMTLAIDPGTQFYGLPIHKEWDSKTIAHNTISVDQQQQQSATGKLLGWHAGNGWTAVRMDAGPVYAQAHLERTLLLTPQYVLIVDRCTSVDQQAHTFDWAYHNLGVETLKSAADLQPYSGFPQANGYSHLTDARHASTADRIDISFVADPSAPKLDRGSNSTSATHRSGDSVVTPPVAPAGGKVELDLSMLQAPGTDVYLGNAPGPDLRRPVPFVLVRRSGTDVTFAAVLKPAVLIPGTTAAAVSITQIAPGEYRIEGAGFQDTFADLPEFQYHRSER